MNETTKNRLGLVLMVGIIVLAIAALWYAGSYAKTTDVNYSRSFSVAGEGKVVAVPDIARFTFSVVTEGGKDLAALQTDNVKKANAAIDFLKKNGVDSQDITTQAFNIQPRYQNSYCGPIPYGGMSSACPPATIVGYTVNQTIAVKVRNLEKVGDLLAGVVSAGANTTTGPSFEVDNPAKLESEARAKAIEQAREKAEAVAKAGHFGLGRLISVDEGAMPYAYGKGGGVMMDMVESRAAAPIAPTIEVGSQDVIVNVTLRYEID